MPDSRRLFGTAVEQQVAQHLAGQGYRILAQQYRTPFGEVDLVCQDGDELVFVEVKARASRAYGYPEESVHSVKLKKIIRAAQAYLQRFPEAQSWRVDVVAVDHAGITHLKGVDTPDGVW
ncbi:YraN family protein [Candidatus Parcubacteria bacterium]|nr:YraN family protein [Candidatus Parcubacteria bacterium]